MGIGCGALGVRIIYGATRSRSTLASAGNACQSSRLSKRRKASVLPLCGAASKPVGFIEYHQVPARAHKIVEPLGVVVRDLFAAPATPGIDRLDRVERADHLLVTPPKVWIARLAAQCWKVGWREQLKGFAKVGQQFLLPLAGQPGWHDDQAALDETAQLEFALDQPGLDRFAKADLVG